MRPYYNWVSESVLIGALPLKSHVELLKSIGVTAVVNMCEEYAGPIETYKKNDIRQLHLPTRDYTCPKAQDLRSAVDFINHEIHHGRVYVHCKAGRQRSGAVVLCWLAESKKLSASNAQALLLEKRLHANRKLYKQASVLEFVSTGDCRP
jgi:atypical dual specificity phosphatase